VEDPGVVGRNVRLKSRLPPAAIEAGSAGSVPSVNSELLEVTVETLAGLLLGSQSGIARNWCLPQLPAVMELCRRRDVTGEPPGKVYR
jgi:hypothetical protein